MSVVNSHAYKSSEVCDGRTHVCTTFLETEHRALTSNACITQTSVKMREADGCTVGSSGTVAKRGGHLPPPGAAPPQL